MAFSFLHCADLHLGSPFLGLALKDEALAARFAAASREAFSALVDAALAEKVAFVLIAGDVYDGEWRDTSIGLFFNREMGRLARAGIPVYLVRGNHDAASEVTKSITLPRSVHEFPSNRARWADVVVDCTGLDTEASILSAVEGSLDASVRAAEGRAMAVRISLSGPTALHDAINADPHHWQTEVQGAAHRLHEDVWLEKLQLQTRPLESEQTGPTDFDIAPLIDEVAQDAEVLRLLTAELDEIRSRHAFTDLAPLIEDARALLLGRLRAGGA